MEHQKGNMPKKTKTIQEINISNIIPNPNQPRKRFQRETLEDLAESIKTFGVIQPIAVRRIKDDLYELVSGERRLRASEIAGMTTVPAILTEINDRDSAILAIVENVQRENLSYFEEAESYRQLMQYYGLTQEQIADKIGKSQSFIANKIRLLKLDQKVIARIIECGLSERHARALLRIPDSELQLKVIHQVEKKGLTVKKTEELVEKIRNDVMLNNYDEQITSEKKARVKSYINAKIYVNTIKSAFKTVQGLKKNAEYKEIVKDDYVEIRIKIPK